MNALSSGDVPHFDLFETGICSDFSGICCTFRNYYLEENDRFLGWIYYTGTHMDL